VKPQVVVLLGATAAQSIMGPQFKLMQNRGTLLQTPGPVGRTFPSSASWRRFTLPRCCARPTRKGGAPHTNRSLLI